MSGKYSPGSSSHYSLLMRHASKTEEKRQKQITGVARGLADYKTETAAAGWLGLEFSTCLHAGTGPGLETAQALQFALLQHEIEIPLSSSCGLIEAQDAKHGSPDPKRQHDPFDPAQSTASPYRRHVEAERQKQLAENTALIQHLVKRVRSLGNNKNAILVICHAPQIDWLLDIITRPRRRCDQVFSHFPPSLVHGEIACIELDPQGHYYGDNPRGKLIWTLDPTPLDDETDDTYKELLAKIKSKMDTSKLLASIVVAGLAYVLGVFKDLAAAVKPGLNDPKPDGQTPAVVAENAPPIFFERPLLLFVAVAVLLLATGLYASAYISYDRLLMPRRFWADVLRRPETVLRRLINGPRRSSDAYDIARRPLSSIVLVTYQNMQRIWFRAFMPATWLTMAGLAFLAYAATVQTLARAIEVNWGIVSLGVNWAGRVFCAAICFGIPFIVWWWHRRSGPVVGAQD